ncbi:MAG TPA: hypothetical protein PKJ16_12210 [Spirochaetota bacterium]|nr:hypothetical protein [Spirochaetota bacterium]HOS38400.1 hypothetical protein [Spirochaetota bacterium]HPU87777.1 hypothetical protein [Spirochaetota bacterium]
MAIYSTWLVRAITFGFATGITLFTFILVRKQARGDIVLLNHEQNLRPMSHTLWPEEDSLQG